jgi:hypothetical protein
MHSPFRVAGKVARVRRVIREIPSRVLVDLDETVHTDPRAEHVMFTLRDGVLLSLKRR